MGSATRRELAMGEVFELVVPAVQGFEDRQMGRSGRRGVILVDETAEDVAASDLEAREQDFGRSSRHFEPDAPVWPLPLSCMASSRSTRSRCRRPAISI